MFKWFLNNWDKIGVTVGIISFLVTMAGLAWSAVNYVGIRKDEHSQREYENYHKLILELATGKRDGEKMKAVSQQAIIFELRRFTRYRSVTIRILQFLIRDWAKADNFKPSLKSEVHETMSYLSSSRSIIGIRKKLNDDDLKEIVFAKVKTDKNDNSK